MGLSIGTTSNTDRIKDCVPCRRARDVVRALAAACQPEIDRQDIPNYGEIVTDTADQHEYMPDGMTEHHPLSHVEQGANGVAKAAGK